jgi:hypothetical protein
MPIALAHVIHPNSIILGDVINLDEDGYPYCLVQQDNVTFANAVECWNGRWHWHQPGMIVPRMLWQSMGSLDESLVYLFDRDWLCRLLRNSQVCYLHIPVAKFRIHPHSKHGGEAPGIMREHWTVTQRYWNEVPSLREGWLSAVHTIREAGVYLALDPSHAQHWNRLAGARLLWRALGQSPRIIRSSDFLRLCLTVLFRRAPRISQSSIAKGRAGSG